jgi:hypothetical protein
MFGESQQSPSLPTIILVDDPQPPPILLIDPQPSDVMLGRGRRHLRHPGNLRLVTVLDQHKLRYDNASSRQQKTVITNEIVQIMQMCGAAPGRFLRLDSSAGGWYEVSDEVARVKVGTALRYALRSSERRESSLRSDQASFYQQATVLVADQLQLERQQSGCTMVSLISTTSTSTIGSSQLGYETDNTLANPEYDLIGGETPTKEEARNVWLQKHCDLLAKQQAIFRSSIG